MNNIRKTAFGTEKDLMNGLTQIKYFKFTTEDIGKFIVIAHRYEQKMMYGGLFGTRLEVNSHKLDNNDLLFGVYEICYHSWGEKLKDVSYKIYLKPIDEFKPWCPDRSWYTSDMESHINHTYNLFEENPLFDNADDAIKFAIKKNEDLYKYK